MFDLTVLRNGIFFLVLTQKKSEKNILMDRLNAICCYDSKSVSRECFEGIYSAFDCLLWKMICRHVNNIILLW